VSLWIVWSAGIIASLLPWRALASCAPTTPFCQKLPDRTDKKTSAIFLGIVKRVATPARSVSPTFAGGRQPDAVSPARKRVGDPVQTVEKEYPIARFQVTESFVGAESAEFEVRMTSDFFIGAIPQQVPALREGEVWLVEAYYDNHEQQWMTSTCQRTKLAEQAGQDIEVLRAWVVGQRLPGRITGQVSNPGEGKNVSAARVYLRAEKGTISTTTDGLGQFSFDNVAPGIYEATTEGGRSMKIDLTRAWCSHVVFLVE
jgi:hypothetical protein